MRAQSVKLQQERGSWDIALNDFKWMINKLRDCGPVPWTFLLVDFLRSFEVYLRNQGLYILKKSDLVAIASVCNDWFARRPRKLDPNLIFAAPALVSGCEQTRAADRSSLSRDRALLGAAWGSSTLLWGSVLGTWLPSSGILAPLQPGYISLFRFVNVSFPLVWSCSCSFNLRIGIYFGAHIKLQRILYINCSSSTSFHSLAQRLFHVSWAIFSLKYLYLFPAICSHPSLF